MGVTEKSEGSVGEGGEGKGAGGGERGGQLELDGGGTDDGEGVGSGEDGVRGGIVDGDDDGVHALRRVPKAFSVREDRAADGQALR